MKRIVAFMLCVVCALGFTGCSDIEIEHFDKSMYKDMTGVASYDEMISIKIDPENLADAVLEINDKMSLLNESENKNSSNDFEEYSYTDDDYTEMFVEEFLSEARSAFDENKMFNIDIDVKGAIDFDNMYSDEALTCKFNNISFDCGSVYARGDKIYIDKKIFYTIGVINFIYDMEMLSEYYTALDELFADNEYVVMSYGSTGNSFGNSNFAASIVDSTNILQYAQMEYYEEAKEILKNFDTGCVSRIENGTRFEIKSYEFADVANKFTSYIRQHNESAANLVNNYMSLLFATSMGMYGSGTDGMEYLFDGLEVTGNDIIETMDGIKEVVKSPEFNIIFDTLDITYTDDITESDNIQSKVTTIKGSYNDKNAFTIETKVNLTNAEGYEFAALNDVKSIDYVEFYENLTEIQNDLMYGDFYSDSYYDSYDCPNCDEVFEYLDTHYCDDCGFVHDFYEFDANCNIQHGCELANEVEQIIA